MAIDDWARAIASIESAGSGGYSALGPVTQKGNRAYGKYQVMDFNIGPWTEKYLGRRLTPQEFLASPEAQETVFRGEFGGNVEKYGSPQEAASVWFTGQPMSRGATRKDILGTTGSGYISKFNRALGNVQANYATPTIMTKGGQAVEPDQIKKDAMAQSTGVMGMAGAQPSGMTGQRTPIKERFRDPDFWNELALTFHSMSSFPNEAAIRSLESRVSTSRERRREQDQLNKTIAFFEKSNMPQLAELARVSPTAAINAYGQMIKPTSTSAASPLGKLVEDYKRGLITKEQLDAAIAKANAQSPGLGVSIGKDGTVQITQGGAGGQTNKLVQQVNAAQELLAGIERYRSAFKEAGGPKLMPGTAKTRLDAAKTSLMMQLKDVFELGAITGPDMQILEGLVINATDPANYALDALGISSFADRFEANMTELEQQIQGALARNYRRLGIQSPTNPAPPKAGQSNGAQSTSGGSSRFSVEN